MLIFTFTFFLALIRLGDMSAYYKNRPPAFSDMPCMSQSARKTCQPQDGFSASVRTRTLVCCIELW